MQDIIDGLKANLKAMVGKKNPDIDEADIIIKTLIALQNAIQVQKAEEAGVRGR